MTDRAVMQMALEALTCTGEDDDPGHRCGHCDDYVDRNGLVRAALQTALEQQAEPVHGDIRALKYRVHELEGEVMGYKRMLDVAEAQPPRKPLTIKEINAMPESKGYWPMGMNDRIVRLIRAIEQAHGIGEKP